MPRNETQLFVADRLALLSIWFIEKFDPSPVLISGAEHFLRWAVTNWDSENPQPLIPTTNPPPPPPPPPPLPPPPPATSSAVAMTLDVQPST